MAGNIVATAFLCLPIVLTLIFNVFFVIVFIRRRRLRTYENAPRFILYLNLSLVDTLAVLLWTLFTAISATTGEWIFPSALCKVQVFMMMFCNIVNAHSLLILMFERFLRVFKPSKHQEIFFDFVVLLLLLAIYIFDAGIAGFTLWGWGVPAFDIDQYQCAVQYEESVSHFDFTLAFHFGIPFGLIIVFYVAVLVRIFLLRRKLGPGKPLVLEENMDIVGDSYTDRLKKQYLKFKGAANDSVKPKIKKTKEPRKDGFQSSGDDSDSEPEKGKAAEEGEKKKRAKRKRKNSLKKIYYLTKEDINLMHVYAVMAAVYLILWLPYIVRSYIYTYQYFETTLDKTFILAATVLSHYGSCYKIPFLLFSDKVRRAVKKTLGMDVDDTKPHDDVAKTSSNSTKKQTTEL